MAFTDAGLNSQGQYFDSKQVVDIKQNTMKSFWEQKSIFLNSFQSYLLSECMSMHVYLRNLSPAIHFDQCAVKIALMQSFGGSAQSQNFSPVCLVETNDLSIGIIDLLLDLWSLDAKNKICP